MHKSIGEVAKHIGISISSIRFYEKKGLLGTTHRTTSGRRVYDLSNIQTITLIANSRRIGLSIEQIRSLIELLQGEIANHESVHAIIQEHLDLLSKREKELQAHKLQLSKLLGICNQNSKNRCSILSNLQEESF